MSAHETPRSSGGMQALGATIDIHLKLEKHQILVCWQGGAAPYNPHQALFRRKCVKKADVLKISAKHGFV